MITITCDLCGSEQDVRPAFITVWNGTKFDLCKVCCASTGLGPAIDGVGLAIARHRQGLPPEAAS